MKKRFKILIIILSSLLFIFIATCLSLYCMSVKQNNDFDKSVISEGFIKTLNKTFPLSNEELEEMVPYDKEKEKKLEALPLYNKDDTWDIYIYMCGSDLESSYNDNLSDINVINLSLYNEENGYYKEIQKIQELQAVLQNNNMDFPSSFYDPVVSIPNDDDIDEDSIESKGSASEDLRAITSTPLTPNIRFVIQTGGAKKWDYPGVNPNRTQRFIYDQNGLKEVYNGPIENMGSIDGLKSFLSFIQDFNANHKFFIFWDHGEGAFGAEHDELFNDKLELQEMREAFDSFYDLSSINPPFELLGFDACLMGSAEVSYYLRGISNYYVASEDIEYGGWNYENWISSLCENPNMNGAMLGKVITDSFIKLSTQQYLLDEDGEVPNTLCVYDSKKMSLINEKYASLMEKALIDSLYNPHIISLLTKASSNSIRYAANDYKTFNTCDLSSFMENLKPLYEKEANEIISLIDEATLYSRGRGHNKYSKGLSIYFPTNIKDLPSLLQCMTYIDTVAITPSLKALYYYKSMGVLNEELNNYLLSKNLPIAPPLEDKNLSLLSNSEVTFNNDNTFSIDIDENLQKYINSARLLTARREKDKITYLEELPIKIENQKITAPLTPESLFLDINELSIEYMYKTNDIVRYKSPILINGIKSSIVIDHNTTNNTVVISGVKDESLPSDSFGRVLKSINKGDKITPLYYTESGFYLEEIFEKGNEVKYKNNLLRFNDKRDGDYLLCIELQDLRGNVYTSPIIQVSMLNRKLKDAFVNKSVQGF